MKYSGKNGEYFEIVRSQDTNLLFQDSSREDLLSIFWFKDENNVVVVDGIEINIPKNGLLSLTAFHKLDLKNTTNVQFVRFNKPFYCILDHDSEVGCKGILFFGAQNLPVIFPTEQDLEILGTVWKMIELEMASRDNLQLEMLQMMLKRLFIL